MIGVQGFPPGVICFPSGDLQRYTDFFASALLTHVPHGTHVISIKGTLVARNKNQAVRTMLEQVPNAQWFWSMGDDHVWPPDLLPRLLARQVDVVAPVAMKRKPPFGPVVYKAQHPDGTFLRYQLHELPRAGGLLEVVNCSTAGMLVSRRVLEAVRTPEGHWFQTGQVSKDGGAEDLDFVTRVRAAGFQVWVDLDAGSTPAHPHRRSIGHLTPMTVYLAQQADGQYAIELDLDGASVALSAETGLPYEL